MAMLAEKRKRVKYCLNPNGNQWNNDDNKFGQKLLEKMGWQKGQGLGANNQGITERLKVAFKFDSTGLGFKEKDNLLHQQNNFQNLLSQLNDESSGNDQHTVSSLEAKSKKSKTRVHYKKFTRGKDISRYSSKDLSSILGTALPKDSITPATVAESKGNLINRGSMDSYFKNKLMKTSAETAAEDEHKNESYENEHEEVEEISMNAEENALDCRSEINLNVLARNNEDINDTFGYDTVNEKKKHKKRKRVEVVDNEFELQELNSQVETDTTCIPDSISFLQNESTIQDSETVVRKKHKKSKNKKSADQCPENNNGEESNNICEHRELDKHENEFYETALECINSFEDDSLVSENNLIRKSSKKKKQKKSNQEEIDDSLSDKQQYDESLSDQNEIISIQNDTDETIKKLKKKSKKRKHILSEEDTYTINNEDHLKEDDSDTVLEVKVNHEIKNKHSKSKKRKKLQENFNSDVLCDEDTGINNSTVEQLDLENPTAKKNKLILAYDSNDVLANTSEFKPTLEEDTSDLEKKTNSPSSIHLKKKVTFNFEDDCFTNPIKSANNYNKNSINRRNDMLKQKMLSKEFKKKAKPAFNDFVGSNLEIVEGYGTSVKCDGTP